MVDDSTLDKMLYLSRLQVSRDERSAIAGNMSEIIDYFAILSKYDTSGVTGGPGEAVPAGELREDAVREGLAQRDLKGLSPHFLDGYFSVPRVLDEG